MDDSSTRGSIKKPPPAMRRRRKGNTSPVPNRESTSHLASPEPIPMAPLSSPSHAPTSVPSAPVVTAVTGAGDSVTVKPADSVGMANNYEDWIVVFGYPMTDLDRGKNAILQDFLQYGDIEQHDYQGGNHLFIRYRKTSDADDALTRDGRPLKGDKEFIIGVQKLTKSLLQELGRKVVNGVVQPPRGIGVDDGYSAVRRYQSDINLAPQRRETNICSRLIELIFSY
jgi:hypothetical protein